MFLCFVGSHRHCTRWSTICRCTQQYTYELFFLFGCFFFFLFCYCCCSIVVVVVVVVVDVHCCLHHKFNDDRWGNVHIWTVLDFSASFNLFVACIYCVTGSQDRYCRRCSWRAIGIIQMPNARLQQCCRDSLYLYDCVENYAFSGP